MKNLLLLLLVLIAVYIPVAAQAREQSGVVKTANGYLVVWNEPGNYYTIEIRGGDVRPIPEHQLWFTVDGKFFQIVTPAISEFKPDAIRVRPESNSAILAAHRDWEVNYISETLGAKLYPQSETVKLSNGVEALAWSFVMPQVAEKQTAKKQLYLSVVKGDRVLALNTVVEQDSEEKPLSKLLIDTMLTLKPSEKPLSLEKASEMVKKGN